MRKRERKIGFTLILLDQLSKFLAFKFGLASVNQGILFGILFPFDFAQGRHSFIVSLLVVFLILALVIWLYFKRSPSLALLFVIAGGISNLLDRFFYGGVVDFITLPFMPIFNMADILVTVGFVLIFIDLLKKKKI